MPTLNFTMFVDNVIYGRKRQTIRKLRKRPIKVGDKLFLYMGLRTKKAKTIADWMWAQSFMLAEYQSITFGTDLNCNVYVICKEVHDIEIPEYDLGNGLYRPQNIGCYFDGIWLDGIQSNGLAIRDGFNEFIELHDFIEKTHGLPFKGQVIRW